MNWVEMVVRLSQTYEHQRDALNALDSALGDGDHGTSLSVAFKESAEKAALLENPQPADVLKVIATTLMNRMGGSAGALYGTLFLRVSMSIKDKADLTTTDLLAMLEAGLEGVMQRGKTQPGDKTMVDALAPAVSAFRDAVNNSKSAREAFEAAAQAARNGAQKTTEMIARRGRAKFVGERSLGHMDAGAVSIALMFETLRDYWKEQQDA